MFLRVCTYKSLVLVSVNVVIIEKWIVTRVCVHGKNTLNRIK